MRSNYIRVLWWRRDVEAFDRVVMPALAAASEAERASYTPLMIGFGSAIRQEPFDDVFRVAADASHASLRRRSFFYQLSAEANALAGNEDAALDSLQRGADVLLFDVVWLDRCPVFDGLRDDPRFARVRAIAAARATQIWS